MDKLKKEGKVAKANLKEAERENSQSKKEIEELWIGLVAQKKEIKKLQAGFAAQKKELEAEFVAQNELETEYQKQVDKMYSSATVVV